LVTTQDAVQVSWLNRRPEANVFSYLLGLYNKYKKLVFFAGFLAVLGMFIYRFLPDLERPLELPANTPLGVVSILQGRVVPMGDKYCVTAAVDGETLIYPSDRTSRFDTLIFWLKCLLSNRSVITAYIGVPDIVQVGDARADSQIEAKGEYHDLAGTCEIYYTTPHFPFASETKKHLGLVQYESLVQELNLPGVTDPKACLSTFTARLGRQIRTNSAHFSSTTSNSAVVACLLACGDSNVEFLNQLRGPSLLDMASNCSPPSTNPARRRTSPMLLSSFEILDPAIQYTLAKVSLLREEFALPMATLFSQGPLEVISIASSMGSCVVLGVGFLEFTLTSVRRFLTTRNSSSLALSNLSMSLMPMQLSVISGSSLTNLVLISTSSLALLLGLLSYFRQDLFLMLLQKMNPTVHRWLTDSSLLSFLEESKARKIMLKQHVSSSTDSLIPLYLSAPTSSRKSPSSSDPVWFTTKSAMESVGSTITHPSKRISRANECDSSQSSSTTCSAASPQEKSGSKSTEQLAKDQIVLASHESRYASATTSSLDSRGLPQSTQSKISATHRSLLRDRQAQSREKKYTGTSKKLRSSSKETTQSSNSKTKELPHEKPSAKPSTENSNSSDVCQNFKSSRQCSSQNSAES
jgi:hypothetical protein